MNPLRLSLSILAIAALCSCNQPPTQAVAEPPEPVQTQPVERPVFESELNAFRQAVSESGIAIDVDRPWFGHRSRIERMEALWKRGVLSDDDFALMLISEYENMHLLLFSDAYRNVEGNPHTNYRDEDFFDVKGHIQRLLLELMLKGSYTAIEGALLLPFDGAYSGGGMIWRTMERHPGLVTEVILTSPAIRVITFEGEEYTTEEGYSSYRLENTWTSFGGMALDFAQGIAIYPTDYLPDTTAEDLIVIAEKEIEANPNSPIVGFWQRQIEKIREDW